MTISDNAAALAFIVAGVSAGGWAALITAQVRTVGKRISRVESLLVELVVHCGVPLPPEMELEYAANRDPRELLGHFAAGVQRTHRERAARRAGVV